MSGRLTFFVDDFGTRTICRADTTPTPERANEFSFGLGGLIVDSDDVPAVGRSVEEFCAKWKVPGLHGNKIRSKKGKFSFLKASEQLREEFLAELEALVLDQRIIPHACVVCRPGYRDRYAGRHSESTRWEMCKTAFDISVERAAKFAVERGCELDIVYERTGRKEDRLLEKYFQDLSTLGTAFDGETSERYSPLEQATLHATLRSIRPDGKSNSMLQLADLVLHPLCHITTGKPNRAHQMFRERAMIIDYKSGDETVAVKYSCYDDSYGSWKASLQ